jgi:hypothetical protein
LQCSIARGRWVIPVAAVFVAVLTVAPAQLAAQRAVPTAPVLVRPMAPVPQLPTGTGGALAPAMPDFTPAPVPVAPMPVAPAAPALAAPPAPAAATPAPAPLIRFRCEVLPGDSTCREQAPPDAGGDDESCDCARDFCYSDPAGSRFCEKS